MESKPAYTIGAMAPDSLSDLIAVAAAPWAGRRPRLGGYVTGTGATRGVPAAGGR